MNMLEINLSTELQIQSMDGEIVQNLVVKGVYTCSLPPKDKTFVV